MLNPEEDLKLKTICEFLFFDHLKNEATYPRFEQCFQPLFTESNISMFSIFTEIAGEKRKYITYPRLVRAYQNRSKSKDLTFFVDTLFTDVLHLSKGKVTLSLFWAVMIPSRFLVGHFANHAKKILVAAIVIIPCTMLLLTASSIPAVVMILCVPLRFASGAV